MKLHLPHLRLVFVPAIIVMIVLSGTFALNIFSKSAEAQDTIHIMPLGDSITAGSGSSTGDGYRLKLWESSQKADWQVNFVGSQHNGSAILQDKDHEGHPGWRTDEISEHVVNWLQTSQPQIILLHLGTNDILQGHSTQIITARLRHLIQQITTIVPESIIIVAQITPLRNPTLDQQIQAYNRFIPSLVDEFTEQGVAISSVDMYDAVPLSTLDDGVHPNDKGYAAMAEEWYDALNPLFHEIED